MDGEAVKFGPVIESGGDVVGWLVRTEVAGLCAYLYRHKEGDWVCSRGRWEDRVVYVDLDDEVWAYAYQQERESESFQSAILNLKFR